MVSSGWLNWLHVALQGLWHWPLAEPTQLLLGLLLWSALAFWSLFLALGVRVQPRTHSCQTGQLLPSSC